MVVFSSLRLPDDVITYLTRNGIYAVSMGEETMQVRNRDAVSARKRMPPGLACRAERTMTLTAEFD